MAAVLAWGASHQPLLAADGQPRIRRRLRRARPRPVGASRGDEPLRSEFVRPDLWLGLLRSGYRAGTVAACVQPVLDAGHFRLPLVAIALFQAAALLTALRVRRTVRRSNRTLSGLAPVLKPGTRKPRDRDTLRCVRDNVPLVPADDSVRPRALPALPYSSARCSAATESASIAHPPRIERWGDAAGGEPDPRCGGAHSAVPRVRPSGHAGCSLVRVVQMAVESLVQSFRTIQHAHQDFGSRLQLQQRHEALVTAVNAACSGWPSSPTGLSNYSASIVSVDRLYRETELLFVTVEYQLAERLDDATIWTCSRSGQDSERDQCAGRARALTRNQLN